MQNGLNWCNQCTSLCLKVASEFFATNAPSPAHWTLNSCFGAFLSLGAFGNVSLLHETRCKMGWTGAINGQVCAMKSHQKIFTTNALDPPHWILSSWFGAFHSDWVHFGLFCYYTKVDAKRAEMVELCTSSCLEVASEFFKTNASDQPNWTLISCFDVFRSIKVHLAMFR